MTDSNMGTRLMKNGFPAVAGGIIEGDIRINGHPKTQDTFARVSGYCEQFDIHVSQTHLGHISYWPVWGIAFWLQTQGLELVPQS